MSLFKSPKKQHNCEETMAEFLDATQHLKRNSEPDTKIDSIIALLPSLPTEEAASTFVSLIDSGNHDLVVERLREIEKTASQQAAEALARVVAVTSDKLPRERKKGVAPAFKQAPIFVGEILRCISDDAKRGEIGSTIISESPSLLFVCDLMRWAAASMMRPPVFAPETEERLRQQLADRIESYLLNHGMPIYLSDRKNAYTYFLVLLNAGRADRVRTYLTDALASRPESISEFLWTMFPNRARDVRTGQMVLLGILPHEYDLVSSFIDLSFVADLVQAKFKGSPRIVGVPSSDGDWDTAHAQQFLDFHRAIGEKQNLEE